MFSKVIVLCLFVATALAAPHYGDDWESHHKMSSDQCIEQFITACNANQAEEIILAIQCIEQSGCGCMSGFSAPNVTEICSSKHGNKCQQVQLGQLRFTWHMRSNPNKMFQAMQKNKHMFRGFQHRGRMMHMGQMQFCSSMCASTTQASPSTTASVGCTVPSSTATSNAQGSTTAASSTSSSTGSASTMSAQSSTSVSQVSGSTTKAQSTSQQISSSTTSAQQSASTTKAQSTVGQQSTTMSQASESTTKAASSSSMASSAASTTAGQQSTTSAQQSTTSGMIVGGGGPSTTTAAAQQSSSAQQTTTAAAQPTTTTTAASIQQTTPQSPVAQCIEQFVTACGANELEEIILAIECIQKSGCGCVSGFVAPNVTSICSPQKHHGRGRKSDECHEVNLGAFEMTKVKGQGPNKMLQTVQKHSHLFKGFQHKGNVMHMGQMQFCASNCNVSKHGKGHRQNNNDQ